MKIMKLQLNTSHNDFIIAKIKTKVFLYFIDINYYYNYDYC